MSHFFDQKISELESLGLCKEISNDESEIVAGGMFIPLMYPFVPIMGLLGMPSSTSSTPLTDEYTVTEEEGDGWKSYTATMHKREVKYETN
ncbi:hypothetical protein [Chlorogloeopsis sp. ULAP02]|uniref:hypothetical protein n=1 Tax=Chlorogloeopsis sp. ULAP02 TaxID=3107926 RepID=UPI0031352443